MLECLYAKKYDEIWHGDKSSDTYKILENMLWGHVRGFGRINKRRVGYGKFWKPNSKERKEWLNRIAEREKCI